MNSINFNSVTLFLNFFDEHNCISTLTGSSHKTYLILYINE